MGKQKKGRGRMLNVCRGAGAFRAAVLRRKRGAGQCKARGGALLSAASAGSGKQARRSAGKYKRGGAGGNICRARPDVHGCGENRAGASWDGCLTRRGTQGA